MRSARLDTTRHIKVSVGVEASDPDFDRLIGARVRQLRSENRLSQEKLADAVGISLQQLQKYETGVNRIGASRLYAIATVLGAPVATFYADLPGRSAAPPEAGGPTGCPLSDALSDSLVCEIVTRLSEIDDQPLRQAIVDLLDAYCGKLERDGRQPHRRS